MPTYQELGDSIECDKSEIAVRKISSPTLIKLKKLDGTDIRLHKYKSSIRGIAKVAGELTPKQPIISKSSKININDSLEAEVIEIYLSQRATFEIVSNFSNVHSIKANVFNFFTYSKIVIPWRYVLEKKLIAG